MAVMLRELPSQAVPWCCAQVSEDMEALTREGINSFKFFLAYKGQLAVSEEHLIAGLKRSKELGALPLVGGPWLRASMPWLPLGSSCKRRLIICFAPVPCQWLRCLRYTPSVLRGPAACLLGMGYMVCSSVARSKETVRLLAFVFSHLCTARMDQC